MKVRKLILVIFTLCFILGWGTVEIRAEEETKATAEKTAEDTTFQPDTETSENGTETSKSDTEVSENGTERQKDEEVSILGEKTSEDMNVLSTEVSNVTSVMLSSISQSLSATIDLEQAKLPAYSQEDLMYLSCIIYCEAGNQSIKGKIAVANVVMNRVKSDIFDHVTTIKQAVYDCNRWGRQFSPVYVRSNGKWTTKGSSYEKALTMYKTGVYPKEWQEEQMKECIAAAESALNGKTVIGDYLYFNMGISSTKAKCKKSGASYEVIGCHIFY